MRKQLLLGSTALIAGALAMPDIAAAEEPLRLDVRGYKNEYFGLGDVDDDLNNDWGNTSEFSDGEVHFRGSTDLDNGITVGVHIELEAFGATGDDIDEAYTYLQGDFGKLVIGSENLPDYLTFWGVTAPNVGVPINSGWISSWVPRGGTIPSGFRETIQTTNITLTNDTFNIGYQSPRFSGFQFVAGYAPTDAASSGDPKNAVTDEFLEIHDIFSVGANFSESFDGFDLGLAAGYETGSQSELNDALGADDPQLFKVGAMIGFGGFTIAGSYANEMEGRRGGIVSSEGEAYDIGASYSTGPWGISITYQHGEQEGLEADGDEDEVDAYVAAVSYALGPGITASLSVIHAKWEDEFGLESDGTMGVAGLAIGF